MDTASFHEQEFPSSDETIRIEYYENDVPVFVEEEINNRYGSFHSSIHNLRLTGKLHPFTCTYITFFEGAVQSIYLFERNGPAVKVLNRGFTADSNEVLRFSDFIFQKFPDISKIYFPSIHTKRISSSYPIQQFFSEEEMVATLPETVGEYDAHLGKSTRKAIKHSTTALGLRHPTWCYKVIPGNAIDPDLVKRVVDWNRERMSDRFEVSTYDDDAVRRYMAMTARDGFALAVMIDDRVCAATICCRVGPSYYMTMIGHDKAYDEFSPGKLCCYWTVMECIRRKAREFNFMSGRLRYKYNLSGRCRKYDSLTLYRNRKALLRNFGEAGKKEIHGHLVEVRFSLLNYEREKGRAAKLVSHALGLWRASKRTYRRLRPSKDS